MVTSPAPRRRLLVLGVSALLLGVAACSGPGGRWSDTPADRARSGPSGPWPDPPEDRPVVDLAFTMSDDLASATGTERVRFTPDAQICEVVFRAWPNKPTTAARGNALTVTDLAVDGAKLAVTQAAAGAPAGAPGTLVSAPLPACTAANTPLTVDLAFTVKLGADTDERIGYSPDSRVAWLGTAFPLLAWENGRGWAKDPAVAVTGESATSEVFQLRSLRVDAPQDDAVAGIGTAADPVPAAREGRTVHEFSAEAVRDVTFTVGDLELTEADADGTAVTVAHARSSERADAQAWIEETTTMLGRLSERFGPVPDDHVWISVLPGVSEGVEFPGAIQFGDVLLERNRWLVAHELAHLWFYGLVGNNEARDPWLDEAFATYAQELVAPTGRLEHAPGEDAVPEAVGAPLASFAAHPNPGAAYVDTVYDTGGRALLQARQAAGPEAFDDAIRAYLRDNAYRIATPADLSAALSGLPAALEVLREAGALPSPPSPTS